MKIRTLGLAALAFGALNAGALQAQECENIAGKYAVTIGVPDGTTQDVTVTFEQDGCTLSGLIEGNNQTAIEDGAVEGSTFTFSISVTNQADGSSLDFDWEGAVEGDAISGTWGSAMVGSFEFEGTRADG